MSSYIGSKRVPGGSTWNEAIGNLMLAYAHLEFLSFEWLRSVSLVELERHLESRFRDRVLAIVGVLHHCGLPAELATLAARDWQLAIDHYDFRNRIAHGPLVMVHSEHSPIFGPPDLVGILDYRTVTGAGQIQVESIDLATVTKSADVAVALGESLGNLLIAVQSEIAAGEAVGAVQPE